MVAASYWIAVFTLSMIGGYYAGKGFSVKNKPMMFAGVALWLGVVIASSFSSVILFN